MHIKNFLIGIVFLRFFLADTWTHLEILNLSRNQLTGLPVSYNIIIIPTMSGSPGKWWIAYFRRRDY